MASPTTTRIHAATAEVDGHRVHYLHGGKGPPLWLLHGFTLTSATWSPWLDELAQRFTVVALDLPGHGGSSRIEGADWFGRAARIAWGLADQLGHATLRGIGHSGGGFTLMHMASQRPERVAAMVLVCSGHRFTGEALQLLREDTFERLDDDLLAFYRELHPDGDEQIAWLCGQLNLLADTCAAGSISSDALARITAPSLLVWGDRDSYFPLEIAVDLHRRLPDAQLWVVPGTGHTPIWESMGGAPWAARAFGERVAEFLARA